VKLKDVAFADALLDDNRRAGHGLDALGKKYVGEGKVILGSGIKDNMQWLNIEEATQYAAQDARLTLLVDEAQCPLIKQEDLERVLTLENDLIYAVCEIERNGCRMDVPKLERWKKELEIERERLVMELRKMTGRFINPNSGDSILSLCNQLGIKVPSKLTAKGKPSFGEHELESIKHPAIELVVRQRRVESILSKFVTKYLEALDGDVIRSQFHQLKSSEEDYGTISGRFSSSGGGDPSSAYTFNAQQVMRSCGDEELDKRFPIRELFIPEEGTDYFACDASQIEYRLFGHFANAPKIIRAYNEDENTDFHTFVWNMIKPITPSITRKHTKNVNFARLYGAQLKKIAFMIDASEAETAIFLKAYDQIFPEAKTFMDSTSNEAMSRGYVSTVLGRRARFKKDEYGKWGKIHTAVNRVVQGSAADIFKLKMLRVYNERETLGITTLRQVVHDEQCGDKNPDPKYTKLMEECFREQELKLRIPIAWNLSCGTSWLECN
jgi:DNA polymerase-1